MNDQQLTDRVGQLEELKHTKSWPYFRMHVRVEAPNHSAAQPTIQPTPLTRAPASFLRIPHISSSDARSSVAAAEGASRVYQRTRCQVVHGSAGCGETDDTREGSAGKVGCHFGRWTRGRCKPPDSVHNQIALVGQK